jgi:hypothetical protein
MYLNPRRQAEVVLSLSLGLLAFQTGDSSEIREHRNQEKEPIRTVAHPELIPVDLVEYRPGTLPLIIAAPHGGRLVPETIPDRRTGIKGADVSSDHLARELADALQQRTGSNPHLVICHLKRSKVDCNRDALTGTEGNASALEVWQAYHGFIERARKTLDRGLVIDLHGHGHPERRVEFGYRLSGAQLGENADFLAARERQSSLSSLSTLGSADFLERLRGPTSLGGLLQERGYPSIPSPAVPAPGNTAYFQGGFTVERYRSQGPDDLVTALQVETPLVGVRDTAENRRRFANAFADALVTFYHVHLATDLTKDR